MNRLRIFAATLALVAPLVSADSNTGWLDGSGKPVPESDAQKSRDGFGGMLVVTPDQDWEAKWNTLGDPPSFSTSTEVKRGQTVFVLIFFVNPKVAPDNMTDVSCDVKVIRPNGTVSTNQRALACHKGPLPGNPTAVRLAAPVVGFIGEPNDPAGRWTVEVALRDTVRNVMLPLKTAFTLK